MVEWDLARGAPSEEYKMAWWPHTSDKDGNGPYVMQFRKDDLYYLTYGKSTDFRWDWQVRSGPYDTLDAAKTAYLMLYGQND